MARYSIAIAAIALVLLIAGCMKKEPPVQPMAQPQRLPAAELDINDAAVQIIKETEGLRLTAYQYAGQWLIGYGHAGTARPGQQISPEQAEALLREDLAQCEDKVASDVTVPLTDNEFSALTALCYNIGVANFAQSTVVKRLNAGDRVGAADAFLMWTRAGGTTLDHLETRRARERALFLS